MDKDITDFTIDSHYYDLFDQEGDSTNMTESGSTYDEAFGPEGNKKGNEEIEQIQPDQVHRIKELMEGQGMDSSKWGHSKFMSYEEAEELIQLLSSEAQEGNRFGEKKKPFDIKKLEEDLFIDDEEYAESDRAVNRIKEEEEVGMFGYEYSEEGFGDEDDNLFNSRRSDFD